MSVFWQLLFLLLWLFRLAIYARIVFEIVRMIARSWRPIGASAVALEILYSSTDPPVKLLRRIIPTVRLGGVGFDLSIIVLLIVIWILMVIVGRLA